MPFLRSARSKNNPKHKFLIFPMKAAIVPAANSRWEVKQTETPEPGPSRSLEALLNPGGFFDLGCDCFAF